MLDPCTPPFPQEERHYTCVEALQYVSEAARPRYVSWEMHTHNERPGGKRQVYPMLDTRLVLLLADLGYWGVKLKLNHRGDMRRTSGEQLPEQVTDAVTHNSSWRLVPDVLQAGLPNPRKWRGAWFDFVMKLCEYPCREIVRTTL